jgi:hypothetical protein
VCITAKANATAIAATTAMSNDAVSFVLMFMVDKVLVRPDRSRLLLDVVVH